MKKNKFKKIIVIILLLLVGTIFGTYYLGIQFGNAASKTIESVYKTKKEWDKKEINPIDTLLTQTGKMIDSVKVDSIKIGKE